MNYTSIRGAFYHHNNTEDRGYMFLEDLALGVPEIALQACFNKPRPEAGCDYIYARAAAPARLPRQRRGGDLHEDASRRAAVLEVITKR